MLKIRLLLVLMVTVTASIVLGIVFFEPLYDGTWRRDETVSLCNKVSVFVPAGWARSYLSDGCSIGMGDKNYTFDLVSLLVKGTERAKVSVQVIRPGSNWLSYIYNDYFADPASAAQCYYGRIVKLHGSSKQVGNLTTEHQQINGAQVFKASYMASYNDLKADPYKPFFVTEAYYYTPYIGFYFRGSYGRQSDQAKYQAMFKQIIDSVQLSPPAAQ